MPRTHRKTRKTQKRRKQKGGGTQKVRVLVYSDPNHEHLIHISNLSERRINSIILGALDYLNDHFRERNSSNKYIGSFDESTNLIRINYGILGETEADIEIKNFPPGVVQKILRTELSIVVVDNDVFHLKFVL